MSWFTKASGDAAQLGKGQMAGFMTQDRQAKAGVQAMKIGSQAVPGGQGFQFFPVQVGGPTQYARSRKPAFVVICIYQAVMAAMAIIEFMNILSGIIMILGCMVAFWAFKEDMNITYICWWGVLCVAGFIAGLIGALMGFSVELTTIITKFNIPISCLFGMGLAWYLYSDYETEAVRNDHVGSWLRALGVLSEAPPPPPPANAGGFLPQFGNSGAGAYGSMAKDQMSAYEQQASAFKTRMQGQANPFEGDGTGTNFMSSFGMPAQLPQANPNLPQGQHDTRSDPFMTL